jgi:hypothetical protein
LPGDVLSVSFFSESEVDRKSRKFQPKVLLLREKIIRKMLNFSLKSLLIFREHSLATSPLLLRLRNSISSLPGYITYSVALVASDICVSRWDGSFDPPPKFQRCKPQWGPRFLCASDIVCGAVGHVLSGRDGRCRGRRCNTVETAARRNNGNPWKEPSEACNARPHKTTNRWDGCGALIQGVVVGAEAEVEAGTIWPGGDVNSANGSRSSAGNRYTQDFLVSG